MKTPLNCIALDFCISRLNGSVKMILDIIVVVLNGLEGRLQLADPRVT